jgi:hypothetical protein
MLTNSPSILRGLIFLTVLGLFAQCEKDEPSTEASIESTMELTTNAAMQGKLTIEQSFIYPLQIDMVAKRTDGNQFTFSQTNVGEDKKVRLTGMNKAPFEIPAQQGKYDPIDITLTVQPDPYELIITPGTEGNPDVVDYADFLANAKPSLFFSGKFNNRGQNTKVVISINISDRIRVQATQLGKPAIALSKQNRVKFTVDPSYILQDLTVQALESASKFDHLGEPTILIHRDFNPALYDDVIDRMFEDGAVKAELIELSTKG